MGAADFAKMERVRPPTVVRRYAHPVVGDVAEEKIMPGAELRAPLGSPDPVGDRLDAAGADASLEPLVERIDPAGNDPR